LIFLKNPPPAFCYMFPLWQMGIKRDFIKEGNTYSLSTGKFLLSKTAVCEKYLRIISSVAISTLRI